MWLSDFLSVLLGSLGQDPKLSTSDAAKKAYNEALGPHHPLMLRTVAKLGMSAAPSRKNFNTKLFPGESEEKICEQLNNVTALIDQMRTVLWKFYTDNKLTELP